MIDLDLDGVEILALDLTTAQQRGIAGVDQARGDIDQIAEFGHFADHHRIHFVAAAQFSGGLRIEQTRRTQFLSLGNLGHRQQRQAILEGKSPGVGDRRYHQIGKDGTGLLG